jgi:REP element-mobilizing transposase RayT
MPQSLSRVLVHLIFSTKNRDPALAPAIHAELYPYLAAVLNNDGCPSLRVGGVADHVHLLFGLSRTRTIADVVENVKTSSSKWIKSRDRTLAHFHWQAGYGAFSVSSSNTDDVVEYIRRQDEHHRTVTFQDEFRAFLRRHEVKFDEKYVWD